MNGLLDHERRRVPAIDVVRGVVMVLMTLDHASAMFNAGRLRTDSAAMVHPGDVLDPLQFIARWATHLCAPTFLFLAGTSLALGVARRQREGVPSALVDRDMLARGALLIGLEACWMCWVWRWGSPVPFGVLFAIGASMIAMIVVRRLPGTLIGVLALALIGGGEALGQLLDPGSPFAAATLTGGPSGSIYFLYPFLRWTAFMMLGWAIGARVDDAAMRSRDWLALAGIAAVTFVLIRGFNGYGNAGLLRADGSWLEWLHVSKYPPSLSFAALELSIAFVLLAATWRWSRPFTPLVVLGQSALFYYLLHVHLLKVVALMLGVYKARSLGTAAVAWLATLVLLYPLCRWYLGVKRRHPRSVLRFV
jgi:uncharacterized membrane protein